MPIPASLVTHEPLWRPRARLRRGELPDALVDWLFDSGSLTRRLRRACPGVLRVQVLRQYHARPLPSEARVLRLARPGFVWVREVHLLCDGEPWVFARTLIPLPTLRGRSRRLTRLGTRPLGEVLFADPQVRRGEVEIAGILPGHWLHGRALGEPGGHSQAIWGRRSVFRVGARPLLVYEIFLPGLPLRRATAPFACRSCQ